MVLEHSSPVVCMALRILYICLRGQLFAWPYEVQNLNTRNENSHSKQPLDIATFLGNTFL